MRHDRFKTWNIGNQSGVAIRIGLSGWSYDPWAGDYYPPDLPRSDWLAFAARDFSTVEVNRSFYSLLAASTYRNWRDTVPPGFLFAVKGSRYITHMKQLREVEVPLANFFASGILDLGEKLHVCLWQLPDNRRIPPERITSFLARLPASLEDAVHMAAGHDQRVSGFEPSRLLSGSIRHAIEVRRIDALDDEVLATARARNIAVVLSHSSRWPLIEEETADFSYIRLHGPGKLYDSRYDEAALDEWADRVSELARRGDVLVYFDNDGHAHAPHDALSLIKRINH